MTAHTNQPVKHVGVCAICGSGAAKLELRGRDLRHGLGGVFTVVRCQGCGVVRTGLHPDDLSQYYPESYQNHGTREGLAERVSIAVLRRSVASASRPSARLLVRQFAAADLGGPLSPGMSLLDVGAGSGHIVRGLRAAGVDAWGVEPSERAVSVAREDGLDSVIHGVLDHATLDSVDGLRGRAWDVVRFYHTLEHIADPVQTLQYAADLLTANGRVVIVVPNFDGLGRRLFKSSWDGLELPRHVHHFTHATLSAVLSRAGLEVRAQRTVAVPGVLAGSLAAWRRNGRPRRRLVASLPVQAALLPLELGAALAGVGEGLVAVAQRRAVTERSDIPRRA